MVPFQYNLRSLAVRKTTTLATGLGIALVVFVLSAALMLSAGIRKTLGSSGHGDIAIILRTGADNELSSSIEDSQLSLVKALPGVARDASGPVAIGENIVVGAMEKVGASGVSNVQIRGVPANVLTFRPTVHMVAGHPARPGSDEVVIGSRIRGRFVNVDLGSTFEIKKGRPVTVVGVFEDNGSSYESEVWVDFDVLRAAYRREGYVSALRLKLESTAAFEQLKEAVEHDKRLGLQALRESAYYEKQSQGTSLFIGIVGSLVSVFFSIGAIIGAMITMYAAVAHRQKEIGTLRALGFSRTSILISFVFESTVLAFGGGLVGAAFAMAMGNVKFSMMNFASWSEIVFSFEPTGTVIGVALTVAIAMGFFGGFFPAVRAARVSPVTAMRGG